MRRLQNCGGLSCPFESSPLWATASFRPGHRKWAAKNQALTRGPNMGTRVMQNKMNTKTETNGIQTDVPLSDLASKHRYVEGLKKAGDKGFQLIATSAFVES